MSVPEQMRAAVYRKRGELDVERLPVPVPGEREVLLRVSHCGVCGTDLHLVVDGWGRPDSIGGHEYSGEIVAVGSEVRGWKLGEAVIGGPEAGCGECEYCRAHRPALCSRASTPGVSEFQGAFAEFTVVHENRLLRIPDGVSLRSAALSEPLAVALHGITSSGIVPGQRALITGVGPIGMLTLAALRARGVEDITVSEPSAVRRELALELGASRVIEPKELAAPPLPFQLVDAPCHAAFECSGRGDALKAALGQLARTGTLVILGTGMDSPGLDTIRVLLNELVVTGAYNYDEHGFRDALELLASPSFPAERLIDDRDVPLEGLLSAMERLVAGQIAGKVLVAPGSVSERSR